MRSKKVTLNIPWRLWGALEKKAPLAGYRNARAMLTWGPLYWLTVNKPHWATAPIAEMSPEAQDGVVEDIVSAFESGTGDGHRLYLEEVLLDVVKQFNLPVDATQLRALMSEIIKNRPKDKPGTNGDSCA
jgi:hypothetical protein